MDNNSKGSQSQTPSSLTGKKVQPRPEFVEEVKSQTEQVQQSASSVTNESAIPIEEIGVKLEDKQHDNIGLNSEQALAIKMSQRIAEERGRPISLRVRSVFAVASVTALGAIYSLWISFDISNSAVGNILLVLSAMQLAGSAYLFVGKDRGTAAYILKIYLILQILTLLTSLTDPALLVVNIVLIGLILYAYSSVKNLRH